MLLLEVYEGTCLTGHLSSMLRDAEPGLGDPGGQGWPPYPPPSATAVPSPQGGQQWARSRSQLWEEEKQVRRLEVRELEKLPAK